ncbi:MAG: pirin family protein [Acidimicrobiales bacterium]
MTTDPIALMIEPRERPVGNGIVHRLLPWRTHRMVGPFIFADHMGPDDLAPGVAVDVDAHPHIGLSTLTYLFEGRLVHRDSTGAVQAIEPGDVNWMTAGAGVTHTERTPVADRGQQRRLHGLQSWIALPTDAEDDAPWFEHHDAASIPQKDHGAATVRVVAGTGWGLQSPVAVSSPLVLAEIRLSDEGAIQIDGEHRERAILAIDGAVTVAGQPLPQGHLAVLDPDARPLLEGRGHAMVLGGAPVGKRNIWWNFVHSDLATIEEAKRRWTNQEFPKVPGDHDPWVPLPR